jgi:hypothetical protein
LSEISCDRAPREWRLGDATPQGGALLCGDLGYTATPAELRQFSTAFVCAKPGILAASLLARLFALEPFA